MTKESKYFEALAVAVASGVTIKAAAEAAKCSPSHAYRLSLDPAWRRRVSSLRTEATTRAVGMMCDASTKAVEVLVELMGLSNEPSLRLAAAKAVLDKMLAMSEQVELRARLDALESIANDYPRMASQ